MQPVYLALPSSGWGRGGTDATDVVREFADTVAMRPATAEAMLVGVVEYAGFVHELVPIGAPAEDTARVRVSGFDDLSYASLFTDLTELLEYDRYRLAESGVRAGRPVIVLIVNAAPTPGDAWREAHAMLTRDGEHGLSAPPVITAVAVAPDALCAATEFTFSSRPCPLAMSPASAGRLAAAAAFAACGRGRRGIGVTEEAEVRLLGKEVQS
jgi:uncharacterized protein YegL